jgi:beta-glucosidase
VSNAGQLAGDEVVQLYAIDEVASIVRPQKTLVGFKRLTLAPGESKTVEFQFRLDQLAFPLEGKWLLEAGEFTFEIGKDANTPIFTHTHNQAVTLEINHAKRGFFALAKLI